MRIPLDSVHLQAPRSFYGLTGLGAGDFGAGVDQYGRTNILPALTPTGTWIISSVDGMAEKQTVTTLVTRLTQRVASWETVSPEYVVSGIVGQDTETPASARAALTALAADHCHEYPDACVGVDVQGLINSLIDQYTRWWNSSVSRYFDLVASGASHPMPGVWASPPPGYVAYAPPSGMIPVVSPAQAALDFFGQPSPSTRAGSVDVGHDPALVPTGSTSWPSPPPSAYQTPQIAVPTMPAVSPYGPDRPAAAPAGAAAATTQVSGLDLSWLSEKSLLGIPNGVLVVGGLAIAFFMFRGAR